MGSPLGMSVNGPGNELFAGASLAQDENRRVRARHFADFGQRLAQWRRRANDLIKHRLTDLGTKSCVFPLQPVFKPFAVFDVCARNVPALYVAVVVSHERITSEKPAIIPILFSHAFFEL